MSKLLNFKNNENGSVIVIVAAAILFLVAMTGLAVDASILYKTKEEMRKAANSAALSGVQDLPLNNDGAVLNTVNSIIAANDESDCALDPKIIDRSNNMVTVKLDKEVDTHFMKIFVQSVPISVTSKAVIGILGGTQGVIPIGVSDDTVYKQGVTYPINYTPGDGTKGNFGYLDFANIYRPVAGSTDMTHIVDTDSGVKNSGSDALNYFLKNGFGPQIQYGDVIDTQTGIALNKVYDGLSAYQTDDIVTILLYDHNDVGSFAGASAPIHVTGFAFFKVISMDKSTKEITGEFITDTRSGSINNSAKDWGARGIKLVE